MTGQISTSAQPWERRGTITLTQDSDIVVGDGTFFTTTVAPRDALFVEGIAAPFEILEVTDDLNLKLAAPFIGATVAGASYKIMRGYSWQLAANLAVKMAALLEQWQAITSVYIGAVPPETAPDGSVNFDFTDPLNPSISRRADGAWGDSVGLRGDTGPGWLSGAGAPDDGNGVDGQFYLDTTASVVYGPKAAGTWPAGFSIKGDQGNDGEDGTDGTDGYTILSGPGAPDNGLGNDGDYYIDSTTNQTVYGPKDGGSWPAGKSIKGEKGDPFEIDAIDVIANRSNHDGEADGFIFYASDEEAAYQKDSGEPSGWLGPIPFGGAAAAVNQNTIQGRVTAGSGPVEELTPAQVRALLNVEDGATGDMTGAEIKAAYEGEANTNPLTDALLAKLNSIDATHYGAPLQTIVELAALPEANITDKERRYIEDELSDYFYDSTAVSGDIAPSDQSGGTGFWRKVVVDGETAASIKAKYESNPDTNPYTDAEKSAVAAAGNMDSANNLSEVDPAAARQNLDVPSYADHFELEMRLIDIEGDAKGTPNRIVDSYADQTDVDTAASTYVDYDSVQQLYRPLGTSFDGGHTVGSQSAGGYTYVDRSFAVTNSSTVTKIGTYSTDAQTITVKILRRNSATDYDVVVSETFSHPGGGWADHTLSSPYAVPATGDYYLGNYTASDIDRCTETIARAYFSGDTTGTGNNPSSESSGPNVLMRVYYSDNINNMTLISNAFTADSVPASARLLVKIAPGSDSHLINTDLVGSVTRDDGDNYTVATLAVHTTYSDGTVLYDSGLIDISAQPSGTDMRYKIETDNNKNIEPTTTYLQWS